MQRDITTNTNIFINIYMSDGNFNRQLLPNTDLSSGLRAGKAQMRMRAEQAFNEIIETFLAEETEEKKTTMKKIFVELLK